MKNLILIITIFLGITLNAQVSAVLAVDTDILLGEQVANMGVQLSELKKAYELVKKTADKVEKVNEYFKQFSVLTEVVEEQVAAYKDSKEFLKILKQTNYSKEALNKTTELITTNLEIIKESINLIQQVCKDSYFSMTDMERFELLESERDKIKGIRAEIGGHLSAIKLLVN